ncbi:MAG: succinyl-diaminopimelate desuccinylase [Acidimicrobiales bacterium]
MSPVGDLLALAAELVATPSVSRDEAAMADRVAADLGDCGWLEVVRDGDNVVARTELGRSQRLVVAGHLDTVPPSTDGGARLEGDVLWGVGAADMKGGLAVMLDLACTAEQPAVDVTWCFYAREELARQESGLAALWRDRPDLLRADAAVVCEPTGSFVEAGCQGTMRVVVRMGGVRAHTARPFTGRNAVHRLGPVIDRVAGWEGRSVTLDGCEYVEQLQAVAVDGGVAGNVVPDAASLTVNYRFAPDRDAAGARAFLQALLAELLDEGLGDRLEVVDEADGAPPSLDHPLLAALVAGSGGAPRAKVGWTDVASFWAHGVPAANFGPGDPLLAHHPDERVDRHDLERARAVLGSLVVGQA